MNGRAVSIGVSGGSGTVNTWWYPKVRAGEVVGRQKTGAAVEDCMEDAGKPSVQW